MKSFKVISTLSILTVVGATYGLLETTQASPSPLPNEDQSQNIYPRIVQVASASELESKSPESNQTDSIKKTEKVEDKNYIAKKEKQTEKTKLATASKDNLIKTNKTSQTKDNFFVPFYSQFQDISDPSWKKVGCGIASLAMLIELYEPGKVSVDSLLQEGIEGGAYLNDAGWIHSGLISLARDYGLNGSTNDLSGLGTEKAFSKLKEALNEGPVMASVHYTFDPKNPIPHLVVINGVDGNTVYYNDPSEKTGGGTITSEKFIKAWKKRYIEIRPV
ncbi:MAG: C39 family peptidase [Candidatus Nomurabacteria bacterium]|nr:C39 family peptidase [Candidatus Nomurabacteria bacterium]USN88011.1 MAG: C39 family peptidase [Candidatus Nomurabacteria bacterium]